MKFGLKHSQLNRIDGVFDMPAFLQHDIKLSVNEVEIVEMVLGGGL